MLGLLHRYVPLGPVSSFTPLNASAMASDTPPGATRPPRPTRRTRPKEPAPPPRTNRLPAYLGQLQDYWFHGPQRRFARDAGVSESTLSRLLRGETNPRYSDICKIVALLERKLGRRIDPRDVYEP